MRLCFFGLICSVLVGFAYSQEEKPTIDQRVVQVEEKINEIKGFKISGYIQTQFQHGERYAKLRVGGANQDLSKSFNRIGIARGRVKITYTRGIATGVFQIDLTERGVLVRDAYLSVKEPWLKVFSIQAGVMNRPFGYEVAYSSSRRESPERALVVQRLFPEERDLGAMLTVQAPKESKWNVLKLEAGVFTGNGVKLETDNRKDFIGHLSYNQSFKKDTLKLGAGVSYYNGGVYLGTQNVYRMIGNEFRLDNNPANLGKYGKREYFGLDFQLSVTSKLGETKLTSEYIIGTQTGSASSNKSPNSSSLPTTDSYIRPFDGGYVMLVQDFGKAPLSGIVKYDWYNPNMRIAKERVLNSADLSYQTIGAGLQWKINTNLRLSAYYEFIKNQHSKLIADYENDRADNVFTLRFQYRF